MEVFLVCVLFSTFPAVRYHLACMQCPRHHPSHPKLVISCLCYLIIRQMKFINLFVLTSSMFSSSSVLTSSMFIVNTHLLHYVSSYVLRHRCKRIHLYDRLGLGAHTRNVLHMLLHYIFWLKTVYHPVLSGIANESKS